MIAAHALACIIEKQPEFREPESYDKYACPLFQREMLFPSSKAVFCTDILDILEQATSASVYRMSRDADNGLSVSVSFLPTGDIHLTCCHLLQSGLSALLTF